MTASDLYWLVLALALLVLAGAMACGDQLPTAPDGLACDGVVYLSEDDPQVPDSIKFFNCRVPSDG